MKKKPEATDHNAPIHFRPGDSFGKLVTGYSSKWGVSRNEVARRLGLLAAHDLGVRYYLVIERLADFLGGVHEFEHAARQAHAALDSSDRTRAELSQPLLGEKERIEYLDGWVTAVISGEPVPEQGTAQEQPIRKIRRTEDEVAEELK